MTSNNRRMFYFYFQRIARNALYFLFWFLLVACSKDPELDNSPSLLLDESAIPHELPENQSVITLTVQWAFTSWTIETGEVVEGSAFINEITPNRGGSRDRGMTESKVVVNLSTNKTYLRNKQELILTSASGEISQTIILTQAARPVIPTNISISSSTTYQTISGFGGGNMMWGTDFLTNSEIKSAFGTGEDELGLSIYRVRISSDKNEWPSLVATVKEAKKYDVKILASPWSPPASLKSNNNTVGGHLPEENYAAYASYLNEFVQYMASEGVTIDVVSIQNEPDIQVSYESCDWTATQMLNFIKGHASAITGTKIAAAESFNFKQSYTNPILNDPDALNNFDIVAGHIYGGGLASYPLAEQKNKEIWMTEYLMNQNSGANTNNWNTSEGSIWNETMLMLGTVHEAMGFNWNAYVWWYIRRYYSFLGDGEKGNTRSAILKRGYAMSQYSKFVRPGYVRVGAQAESSTELKYTAYVGEGKVVVVIINSKDEPINEINLSIPQSISSAVAYTTSVDLNRLEETLTPAGNKVVINMLSKSITTVVMTN